MTRPRATGPSCLFLALTILGCTPSLANSAAPPASGGNASEGAAPRLATKHQAMPELDPAHRRAARPHEPHFAPLTAPPPPLTSLPPFVDGAASCFGGSERERYMGATSRRYGSVQKSGGYGTGYGRMGGSHSASAAPLSGAPGLTSPGGISGGATSLHPHKSSAASPPPSAPRSGTRAEEGNAAPAEAAKDSARSYADDTLRAHESARDFSQLQKPPRAPAADWGAAIYLSNDDTMSLSSAQRVIWAIEHFSPIPSEHVRPHELLNYFSFQTETVRADHDFSVLANIAPSDGGHARLSLSVDGRALTRDTRRNVNLSYVVDRSGSMAAEGRMEYLRQGLRRSLDELKAGDIVHVTLFDTTVCQLAENFVVGRDSLSQLRAMLARIEPEGSTNLHDGLSAGYAVADRAYQPTYSNRVVMITDAEANTGVTDEQLIATVGRHYDTRRIRLSGIGVGSTFNDSLLDGLTERGRGAYVFLGSPAEVDAVFGVRFVSLVETIAGDVHFRLHLPDSLAMKTFYGEEASTVKERVQAVHYFAGTSQLFLSDLSMRGASFNTDDSLMLTVEYEDPESGRQRVEEFAWRLGDIAGAAANLDKASLVEQFARTVASLAERPTPNDYSAARYGWHDSSAGLECQGRKAASRVYASRLQADPEVRKLEQLWDTFCARYIAAAPPLLTPAPGLPTPQRPRTAQQRLCAK